MLLLIFLPCVSLAHQQNTPRLVHVRMHADRVELAVAWTIHPGPQARHLRSRFDRNGDGRLGADERDLIAQWLQSKVERAVQLELDGLPLQPEVGSLRLEVDAPGSDEADALRFSSTSAVLLCPRPGAHALVLRDRPEKPDKTVPYRVDLPADWTATGASSTGEATPPARTGGAFTAGMTGDGGSLELRFSVPGRK